MKDFSNNPILKAQDECKIAVIEAANHVIKFYESAVENGIINDFSCNMEPFNQGYVFELTPEFNSSNYAEYGSFRSEFDRLNIKIQPESFFNQNIKSTNAKIEIMISSGWKFNSSSQSFTSGSSIKVDMDKVRIAIDETLKRR